MFYRFNSDICGGLEAINRVVSLILKQTSAIIKDEDLRFNLRLVLNELLINGWEHGNKCDEDKHINLDLRIDGQKMVISVEDEGCGIEKDDFCYDFRDLTTDGRGLVIVRNLTDFLEIDENVIKCRINI